MRITDYYNIKDKVFYSPRVNIKYNPIDKIAIRMSAGKAFRISNVIAENIHHFLAAITCGASAVGAGSMFVYNGPNKGVLISYLNNEQIEVLNNAYKTENS